MDLTDLLKKCAAGNASAWDRFISLYTPLVRKSVRFKLNRMGLEKSVDAVKDISQNIFLKLWESGSVNRINDPSSIKAWLAIISINETHNYCVKNFFRKASREVSLDGKKNEAFLDVQKLVPSGLRTPLTGLQEKERLRILETGLSCLERRKRLAVRFFYYDNRKQKDIARIMNLPLGTVGTLLKRARHELFENIEKILKEKPGRHCL